MPVLGGHREHKWSEKTKKRPEKKHKTHQGYQNSGDIAGQFMDEEAVKDLCKLDADYYKKQKEGTGLLGWLKKLFGM